MHNNIVMVKVLFSGCMMQRKDDDKCTNTGPVGSNRAAIQSFITLIAETPPALAGRQTDLKHLSPRDSCQDSRQFTQLTLLNTYVG